MNDWNIRDGKLFRGGVIPRDDGKFDAVINTSTTQTVELGTFDSETEAARVYDRARKMHPPYGTAKGQ